MGEQTKKREDGGMNDFWEEWWGVFVVLGLALIAAVLVLVSLAIFFDRPSCEATARAMEVPHQWEFWTGCMIQVDGRLIPLDAYKVVRATQ